MGSTMMAAVFVLAGLAIVSAGLMLMFAMEHKPMSRDDKIGQVLTIFVAVADLIFGLSIITIIILM
jgi:hypothetical protein